MNKYKIIENNGGLDYQKLIESAPDYQKFMEAGIEIESYSMHDAVCSVYDNLPNTWRQCYVLDVNTLKMFIVYWHRDSMCRITTTENFHSTLEKSLMKKYKISLNQNKHPDLITYEFVMNYLTVESDSPLNAFRKYCEQYSFVVLDSKFGYVFDTESLDLYYASWSVNEQIGHSSFVKKLEKPIEKPKMKKYKILFQLEPTFETFESCGIEIGAESLEHNVVFAAKLLNYSKKYVEGYTEGHALDVDTLEIWRFWYHYDSSVNTTPIVKKCFLSKLKKSEVKPNLMNNLSFKTLAEANLRRLPLFKNSKGLPAHSKPDGSDWSHAEWLQAVIGELGEYANIMKKVQRGDLTMEEAKPSIEKELADVMTYFAILAQQLNIDLGQAVEDKFNEVSDKVKCDVYIQNDKVVSNYEVKSKKELRDELIKIKEKQKRINTNAKNNFLKAEGYHKSMSFNSTQIANIVVGAMAVYLMNPFYYHKPQITLFLQDLGNGKIYSKTKECEKRTFSMLRPTHLKEMGSEIVKGTLTKILLNGKEYETNCVVKVGDLIQFSDERNILYSLRITELIVS
jgi:NTP pyrophosphatase (non-canonical NTP hydrolase)/F0F1-type ATP synthase assembly protein I